MTQLESALWSHKSHATSVSFDCRSFVLANLLRVTVLLPLSGAVSIHSFRTFAPMVIFFRDLSARERLRNWSESV